MNKRFLSIVILGVLFSPPVMAAPGSQHVVLYEKASSEEGLRPENEITTGQNPLSLTAGEGAECAALANARRERLARYEAQGRSRRDSGSQRAL